MSKLNLIPSVLKWFCRQSDLPSPFGVLGCSSTMPRLKLYNPGSLRFPERSPTGATLLFYLRCSYFLISLHCTMTFCLRQDLPCFPLSVFSWNVLYMKYFSEVKIRRILRISFKKHFQRLRHLLKHSSRDYLAIHSEILLTTELGKKQKRSFFSHMDDFTIHHSGQRETKGPSCPLLPSVLWPVLSLGHTGIFRGNVFLFLRNMNNQSLFIY